MKSTTFSSALTTLSRVELTAIKGGTQADDLAYNIVYVGIRTNPLFWAVKYNVAFFSLFN